MTCFGNIGFNGINRSMPLPFGGVAQTTGCFGGPSIFPSNPIGMGTPCMGGMGALSSSVPGGLTGQDMAVANEAAQIAAQTCGLNPNAILPIIMYRMAAFKNSGAVLGQKSRDAGVTDKYLAQATDLAEFAAKYVQVNGGQIPQNQQQYLAGVQNVASIDMASQGKPPLLPMSAFNAKDYSMGSAMIFAGAQKRAIDAGYMPNRV